MRKQLHVIFITLFLLLLPAAGGAASLQPTGFVNDFAGVMDAKVKAHTEHLLEQFEKATGNEVAVATIPSLNNEPIENAAVQLFQQWGIGKKGRDNGVLFLIAPNDRKVRFEVGYGLEGILPDALTGRILDTEVLPRFKSGDISNGIAAGAIAIVQTIASKEGIDFDAHAAFGSAISTAPPRSEKSSPLSIFWKIIVALVMIYLFIRHPWLFLLLLSSSGRGGGGFGGGFGGFGGGLSGGGGSSRSW